MDICSPKFNNATGVALTLYTSRRQIGRRRQMACDDAGAIATSFFY